MMFNNIEAWLDHFQNGLITEELLSHALYQHVSSNPEYADMLTASLFCSIYNIQIPIIVCDQEYPCVHFRSGECSDKK